MFEERFCEPKFITPQEREKITKMIKGYLSKRKEVLFAYLYGSFIRKEPFRDIDIALFMKQPLKNYLEIESDLSYELTIITGYKVEVKIINSAPVALQMAVLRECGLLTSRDDDKRTDFIQNVSKRYIEYSYLREMAR